MTAAYGPILNPALGLANGGYSIDNPITLGKFTQELRLQSPEDQTLEWRVGVFYTREHTTNVQDVLLFDATTGAPIAFPLTLGHIAVGPSVFTEWAGYGDVTWHATSQFSILLGARYTHDKTTFTQTGNGILVGDSDFTINSSDSPTTFLLNPSFKFNDNLMTYARIASGFRPGGPNVGVPPGLGAPESFAPDKLVSYELGLKSTLLDKHMTIDVAGFYIDWSQIQLTSFAGGFSFLGNGGKAQSQGVEASWQYARGAGSDAVGQCHLDRCQIVGRYAAGPVRLQGRPPAVGAEVERQRGRGLRLPDERRVVRPSSAAATAMSVRA